MKKFTYLIACLYVLLGLNSCGSGDAADASNSTADFANHAMGFELVPESRYNITFENTVTESEAQNYYNFEYI
jgi:hypothetical protein